MDGKRLQFLGLFGAMSDLHKANLAPGSRIEEQASRLQNLRPRMLSINIYATTRGALTFSPSPLDR